MAPPSAVDRTIVARWIEAFNDRDLDGMLAVMQPGIAFHPIRTAGLNQKVFCGHDEVKLWFDRVASRQEVRIAVDRFLDGAAGEVVAAGTFGFSDDKTPPPFCGVYALAEGLIATAHHFYSDVDVLSLAGHLNPEG